MHGVVIVLDIGTDNKKRIASRVRSESYAEWQVSERKSNTKQNSGI